MQVSIFNDSKDNILRRAYAEMSLREERRNAIRMETYSVDSETGSYVYNTHGMVCQPGSGTVSQNVIRYMDERMGRTIQESGAFVVAEEKINMHVWRPDNHLSIIELTSRAMADIKKDYVVVMPADLDTVKLERIAKCLKTGVYCYITDMDPEKIEKILRVANQGVILFLDENIRMDEHKCQLIVDSCQQRATESLQGGEYAEDLALEHLFSGISLQDLAVRWGDSHVQAGCKRRCADDGGADSSRQRVQIAP